MINWRAAAAALLGMLALAAPASASTVSLDGALIYTAAPGETNALTMTYVDESEAIAASKTIVHDPGATITPGANCESVDAHTATCDSNNPFQLEEVDISLLDGDDTVHFTGNPISLTSIH